jgi:succinoglycan biosynthesis protein ExoO
MPQPSPLISVITPAYNAGGFIGRALGSALAQPVALEAVVVDDASSDDTLARLRTWADGDPRVRVLALPRNGGPAQARNAALDAARGDWAAVLDADDAFLPGRLPHMLQVGETLGADVVLDNFYFYRRETDTRHGPGLAQAGAPALLTLERYIAGARPYTAEADFGLLKPLFRRAFLDGHGLRYPAGTRHGEDFLLMIELFLAGARVALTRTPGYLYTTRSSGQSRTRIDYGSQIADARRLRGRDGVRQDARLQAALRQRGTALRRLEAEHGVNRCIYGRDLAGLTRLLLSNRWAGPELARLLRQRFAGQ